MTLDEILADVEKRRMGRTRYEGQEPYRDEVMADEIERLRKENERLRKDAAFLRATNRILSNFVKDVAGQRIGDELAEDEPGDWEDGFRIAVEMARKIAALTDSADSAGEG
jgi:hypothetical protein